MVSQPQGPRTLTSGPQVSPFRATLTSSPPSSPDNPLPPRVSLPVKTRNLPNLPSVQAAENKVLPAEIRTVKDLNSPAPSTKEGGAEGEISANRTDSLPVGGKLAHYQAHWLELFLQFHKMIRKISQGILIAFSDDALTLLHHPLELHSNNKPADLLQTVKKLRDSRAIEEVKDTSSLGYYSCLFLVPKPDGSFRPIIDLKKLNLFLDIPSFKMETLFSIIAALQPQEWITKIDLKDAYHHILVHVNIRKYFSFVIAGKTHQFRVLPFGLSTAPREFTKTLAPVVQLLRTQGIRVHAYLNDWIIIHTQQTIQLLQSLGWTINWKKSMLEPSCILDFLGLHFNLERAIVSPPDSFLDYLTSVLSRLSTSTVMSARNMSSITSQISHFAPSIHHGCLQLRFLQFWIKRHQSQHQQSWDTPVQLDAEFLTQLHWFNRWEVLKGVPLHLPEPTLFFFTDASLTGWGASWQNHHLSGQWSHPESSEHINWLELEAIRLAILHWGPQWHNQTVRVYCDNSTAVAYIRKQGWTHSISLFNKTLELFHILDRFVILLIPTHLPGARNVTADALSRINSPSPTEWRIPQETLTHWGRSNMAAISQTTLSIAFSWMNMLELRLQFHWSLFPRVQITIFQHWFR